MLLLFCLSPFSATLSGARAPEGAFAPICTRSGGPECIFGEVREVLSTLEREVLRTRVREREGATPGREEREARGEGWEREGGRQGEEQVGGGQGIGVLCEKRDGG
jgi:hypothetical protein